MENKSDPKQKPSFITLEKSNRKREIWDNNLLLYGPIGVGKTTLFAHDWAYFANTEGGLGGLEVYKTDIMDWATFSFFCAEWVKGEHQFKALVIDTIERLFKMCQDYVMQKHDIEHPSDMDWGKGWAMLSDEFMRPIGKLAVYNRGLIMISHENNKEIKERVKTYNRVLPNLAGSGPNSAYSLVTNMCDCIIHMGFCEKDPSIRELRLAPTENCVAKKRHKELPDVIELPPDPLLGWEKFETVWNNALSK